MSRLLDFYRGTTTDTQGRLLSEILAWSDREFEVRHDFVQWLFPLPEASRYNSGAPLLSEEDIQVFRSDSLLEANLLKSFDRFLSFLGLTRMADGNVNEGPNFTGRIADVWSFPNHNWLRITRLLRCLWLLGLAQQAHSLYAWLEGQYGRRRFPISDDTLQFWNEAVNGLPFHT